MHTSRNVYTCTQCMAGFIGRTVAVTSLFVIYTGLSEGSRDSTCILFCIERGTRNMDGHAGLHI